MSVERIRLRKFVLEKKANYFSNCEDKFKEFDLVGGTTHPKETDVSLQQEDIYI